MRVREQMLIVEAFDKVAPVLPFVMLGVDTVNVNCTAQRPFGLG